MTISLKKSTADLIRQRADTTHRSTSQYLRDLVLRDIAQTEKHAAPGAPA
jgi:hypothetical protein